MRLRRPLPAVQGDTLHIVGVGDNRIGKVLSTSNAETGKYSSPNRKDLYKHAIGQQLFTAPSTFGYSSKLGRPRLHDLRHTAASHAVMSGENLPLVGKLLGHRRHRTTAGYAHLADSHLVEAAERVGSIIAAAMEKMV